MFLFLTLKEVIPSRHTRICYETIYIALFTSDTAHSAFSYLHSLAFWLKIHVMFDIELTAQMEGILNILEQSRKLPSNM